MLRPAFLLTTGVFALATSLSLGGSAALAQAMPPYQQPPPYSAQPYPPSAQPDFDDLDDEDLGSTALPPPGPPGMARPYPPQGYPQQGYPQQQVYPQQQQPYGQPAYSQPPYQQPGYASRPPGGFIYPDDRQQAGREPVLRPPGDVAQPGLPGQQVAPGQQAAPGQPMQLSSLPPEDQPETGPRKELPPHLKRQEVAFATKEPAGTIIVDTANTYLYYVLGGGRAMRYGVRVGRDGFTWTGTQKVTRKAEWPDWHPPAEMIERQPYLPRFMAGGEGNPMGARAMYLGNTVYRIHGTNQPSTIGQFVSSGCVGMLNEDVMDLFERVKVGSRVVVWPGKPPAASTPVAAAPAGSGGAPQPVTAPIARNDVPAPGGTIPGAPLPPLPAQTIR